MKKIKFTISSTKKTTGNFLVCSLSVLVNVSLTYTHTSAHTRPHCTFFFISHFFSYTLYHKNIVMYDKILWRYFNSCIMSCPWLYHTLIRHFLTDGKVHYFWFFIVKNATAINIYVSFVFTSVNYFLKIDFSEKYWIKEGA